MLADVQSDRKINLENGEVKPSADFREEFLRCDHFSKMISMIHQDNDEE
jgi:hypothetical protein